MEALTNNAHCIFSDSNDILCCGEISLNIDSFYVVEETESKILYCTIKDKYSTASLFG